MRALVAAVASLSTPALACAVCGAGEEASQGSYVVMTLIISGLPLAMLGGIVGYIVVKSRAAAREEKQVGPTAP